MTVPTLPLPRTDVGPRPVRRRRPRRRRLLLLLLVTLSAVPSVTTSMISLRLFTERATIPNDAWVPAGIDVQAEPAMVIEVQGMVPGDRHGGSLTVTNLGSDTLRYALVSAATDPDGRGLRAALQAEVRVASSGDGGCDRFDGTAVYRGLLSAAGFGDPAAGQQDGDRLLGPGERDLLCVRVTLPKAAGNRYQHAATSATFTVVAEQAQVRT
jgi:hypothetical protein